MFLSLIAASHILYGSRNIKLECAGRRSLEAAHRVGQPCRAMIYFLFLKEAWKGYLGNEDLEC